MEASPEDIRRAVYEWLTRADDDLRLATYALGMPEESPPYRLIAYHAQQCAEKCLKAFLVFHNMDFPYTHNIGRLLTLCESLAPWAQSLKDAQELTVYGVTARYPGEDLIVTEEDARRAVGLAERVRTRVRTALRERGMELS